MIKAVRLSCKGEKGVPFLQVLEKPSDDPIFHLTKPNCPIGAIIGIPLCFLKLPYGGRESWQYDNQWATFCKIDPELGGFAPDDWQSGVIGPC